MVAKPSPLYSTLSLALIDFIKTQGKAHKKMLSEREITKVYNVSRTTVRTALKELETLGYIYKRHGKGTFISTQWKERQNLLEGYSFTEQMKELGKVPSTKITSLDCYEADEFIAPLVGIEAGDKLFRLKRIRYADGIPLMKETTFLPYDVFKTLTKTQLEGQSLYEVFANDFHQQIHYADEEFSASILSPEEAEVLDVDPHSACLRFMRTTLNHENRIIEYTISVARSDQFFYKVRHYRTNN